MSASLPISFARCCPSQPCPQEDRCARCNLDPIGRHQLVRMDASLHLDPKGCPLFIDERAIAFFPQPRSVVRIPERAATWLTPIRAAA